MVTEQRPGRQQGQPLEQKSSLHGRSPMHGWCTKIRQTSPSGVTAGVLIRPLMGHRWTAWSRIVPAWVLGHENYIARCWLKPVLGNYFLENNDLLFCWAVILAFSGRLRLMWQQWISMKNAILSMKDAFCPQDYAPIMPPRTAGRSGALPASRPN
ncbi:hypothetical protein D3C81_1486670 [compost metagenome]